MRFAQLRFNFLTLLILTVIITVYMAHSCVALVVWRPKTTFFAPDNLPISALGGPIAVDEDIIAVAALSSNSKENPEKNIMAYAYERNGSQWKSASALQGSDFRDGAMVIATTSIDISKGTIALGVIERPEAALSKGFIYIFTRQGNAWVKQAKISSPDPKQEEFFAESVALDGDTLVASGGGSEFSVFVRDPTTREWSYQAALTLPKNSRNISDNACISGSAVDISENTIVTGSASNFTANCAHVFVRDPPTQTWRYETMLHPQFSSDSYNGFGRSVAIDQDTILVGATHEGNSFWLYGAVYVYRRDSETGAWKQTARLWPKGANLLIGAYSFGASTAIKGDVIAVGNEEAERAVYLFNYDRKTNQWNQRAKLVPKFKGQPYSWLKLDLSEQYLVMSDTSAKENNKRGGFYIFDLPNSRSK